MTHLDNWIKFVHMIFKTSFQWESECISQTKQFFLYFFLFIYLSLKNIIKHNKYFQGKVKFPSKYSNIFPFNCYWVNPSNSPPPPPPKKKKTLKIASKYLIAIAFDTLSTSFLGFEFVDHSNGLAFFYSSCCCKTSIILSQKYQHLLDF